MVDNPAVEIENFRPMSRADFPVERPGRPIGVKTNQHGIFTMAAVARGEGEHAPELGKNLPVLSHNGQHLFANEQSLDGRPVELIETIEKFIGDEEPR